MELNLYCFRDDSVHVSRLLVQNTGIVHLGTMAQVYAVLSHGRLLRMVEMDVLVMFWPLSQLNVQSVCRAPSHSRGGCCGFSTVTPKLSPLALTSLDLACNRVCYLWASATTGLNVQGFWTLRLPLRGLASWGNMPSGGTIRWCLHGCYQPGLEPLGF
jgi:hypothetical protein